LIQMELQGTRSQTQPAMKASDAAYNQQATEQTGRGTYNRAYDPWMDFLPGSATMA